MLTSTDVAAMKFRVALRGYSEEEVDVFLDRVVKSLWEYQADRRGDLSSRDVEQKTFRVALRGYSMEEVDQLLERVAKTLRQYERRDIKQPTPQVSTPAAARGGPGPPAAHPETDEPVRPETVVVEPTVPEPPAPIEPASTVTRLTISRTGEQGGRPYTVLLDDKPLGKVSPGATERFEIPTGMHWVTVKTRKEQSNNVVIEPHQGDQITLSCGPASGEIDDLGRKIEGIVLEMVG